MLNSFSASQKKRHKYPKESLNQVQSDGYLNLKQLPVAFLPLGETRMRE